MTGPRKDGYDEFGRLAGWGIGKVINPPGAVTAGNADPSGENSLTLQCQLAVPHVMTVAFEVGPSSPPGGGSANNIPVAVIEFATNGVTVRRKVSILNGLAISAPAEYVKVKAFDESMDALAAPYELDVSVTPGTRGGFVQPTLQDEPKQTATKTGGFVTFDVPEDAGVLTFRILVSNATAKVDPNAILVDMTNSAGVIASFQNPIEMGWVHLAPGTTQIVVTDNDSVDADVYIQWGIEG